MTDLDREAWEIFSKGGTLEEAYAEARKRRKLLKGIPSDILKVFGKGI